MDPAVQITVESSSKRQPCLERNINEQKVSSLFLFQPFLSVLFYSFTLEGSLLPGMYSSLTEHSLATVPVALGKNRAYSHCACFPLETFHPVYIILYMAPSHATTSCKNISFYILTMSGLLMTGSKTIKKLPMILQTVFLRQIWGVLAQHKKGNYFAFLEETLKIPISPMLITYLLCCFSPW